MILDDIDCTKNYSFPGVFWFEDEFEHRFSGTLEYTPEKGIILSLVSVALNGQDYLLFKEECSIQKMYGTLQYEGNSVKVTLLDVFLAEGTASFDANGVSRTLHGTAQFLVLHTHLKQNKIKSLNIEYDGTFKSFFFFHTSPIDVSEIEPYTKKKIRLSNTYIGFDINYSITPFYAADQLDNVLCDTYPKNKSSITELKKFLEPFLKEHEHEIGIRQNLHFVVSIKGKYSNMDSYLREEKQWRSFFELMIDKPIAMKHSWLNIETTLEDGKKHIERDAVLYRQYPSPKSSTISWHKFHLPINIDAFSGKNNLSRLQKSYEVWDQLHNDKKWEIVLNGLKSIVYNRGLIKNENFVILVAYIETVLDLLGHKETHLDECIENYANEWWKKEVNSFLKKLPRKDSLGKKISELRNSVVHPKSAEKENGKYFKTVIDEILMQKIYAYTSGLFVKMVLQHLYEFDEKSLEKYIKRFIQSRSGFYKVKYDKNYTVYKQKLDKRNKKQKSTQPPKSS